LDLSGEKLEWIEGMMNQARRVSGMSTRLTPVLLGEAGLRARLRVRVDWVLEGGVLGLVLGA